MSNRRPRRRLKRASELEPSEVRRLYEDDGLTLAQVGETIGASARVVKKVLVQAGGAVRGTCSPHALEDEGAVIAQYEAGATITELAETFGVNYTTISWCLERHGVVRGRKRGREHYKHVEIDITALVERYQNGERAEDLAGEFECSKNTIINRLIAAGVWDPASHGRRKSTGLRRKMKPRKPKLSSEQVAEMRRLREENGVSLVRLGARFGVHWQTAKKYLDRLG